MSLEGVTATRTMAQAFVNLLEDLTPEQWAAPSACAGWRVQDVAAHVGASLHGLVEPHPDGVVTAPTAEAAQDQLVDHRRSWTAEQVLAEIRTWWKPAVDRLGMLQEEPLGSEPMTMRDLGIYPRRALADAFAFDLYCHRQVDLLGPDGPLRPAGPLADVPPAVLTPAVRWMLTGLPQMCPGVAGALSAPVRLVLDGADPGVWTLRVEDGATVVEEGLSETAAVVTGQARDFVRWGTRRTGWRALVTITGDRALAEAVLDTVDVI